MAKATQAVQAAQGLRCESDYTLSFLMQETLQECFPKTQGAFDWQGTALQMRAVSDSFCSCWDPNPADQTHSSMEKLPLPIRYSAREDDEPPQPPQVTAS